MKPALKNLTASVLALGATLMAASPAQAQITVKVDSTKTWNGYLNVYSTNNAYSYGQGFGAVDLRARFVPTQPTGTRVVLAVNTNTYNPAAVDHFCNLEDGTPNKHLEANFYVDVGTTFGGNDVTFVGTVESNTIPAGWTVEAVIKQFGGGYSYIGDSRQALVTGEPFSLTRFIPAGNICQYGFIMFGPNAAPGSFDALQAASIIVDNADPSITGEPTSQRVLIGGTASFHITATGGSALSYVWKRDSTNLVNGGNISGANTATLTVSNAQLEDSSTYQVSVTDLAGTADSHVVTLRVLPPDKFANALDNPSFEENVIAFQTVPEPWVNFTGSALLSGGEFIWDTAHDGTNVVQVYNAGQYNGIYQDAAAAPGDVFAGDCWMWQSAFDPLLATVNEAYLEVQFRQGNANPIAIYSSVLVTNGTQFLDTWMFLQATNGVAAGYAAMTTTNSAYLIAPPGTDHVRFQITLHKEGAGSGSVFVDEMRLMKKIPVMVKSRRTGASVELSWLSQGATSYQVVYKNSLTDADWTPVGALVPGDGTTKTVSYPATEAKRFYSVLTK